MIMLHDFIALTSRRGVDGGSATGRGIKKGVGVQTPFFVVEWFPKSAVISYTILQLGLNLK